jgi:hypothetical protein
MTCKSSARISVAFFVSTADHSDRVLTTNASGRNTIRRINKRDKLGFISIFYSNRALEWINIRRLFQDTMIQSKFSHLCPLIDQITIAWSYADTLALVLYKPAAVFKKISFVRLLQEDVTCACTEASRFIKFCDPQILLETSSFCKPRLHVRTMNTDIIQNKHLRLKIAQGLNHIPLQPMQISKAVATIMHAFEQLVAILGLFEIGFLVEEARKYLHSTCLSILKTSSRENKNGFRFSGSYIFDILAIKNEVQWLLQHLYCSGLDKVANNICLICIKHIRLMALERLMGMDFSPCKNNNIWSLPSAIKYWIR